MTTAGHESQPRVGTDRIGLGLALASVVGLALAYPAGVLVDLYGRRRGPRADERGGDEHLPHAV